MSFLFDDEEKQIENDNSFLNMPSSNELRYITKVKQYLMILGLCKNNCDYSINWLGKAKHYYGMSVCENRMPSISCLIHLFGKLADEKERYEEIGKKGIAIKIDKLLDEARQHLFKKITKRL